MTEEVAEKALKEYDEIRNIPDRACRKAQYDLWEAKQREKIIKSKEKIDAEIH